LVAKRSLAALGISAAGSRRSRVARPPHARNAPQVRVPPFAPALSVVLVAKRSLAALGISAAGSRRFSRCSPASRPQCASSSSPPFRTNRLGPTRIGPFFVSGLRMDSARCNSYLSAPGAFTRNIWAYAPFGPIPLSNQPRFQGAST